MKNTLFVLFLLSTLWVSAQPNSDANRLMVIKDGKVGYIDTLGKTVIAPSFLLGSQFSEGLASVATAGSQGYRYSFINDQLDIVIKTIFDAAGDFNEGLARVQVGGKWGYINKEGKTAIEPQFQLCYEFNEGYAQAQKKNKWGLINKKGDWVLQPVYNDINPVGQGLVAVQENFGGSWKFMDIHGKLAIKDTFERAGFFFNGLAPVRKNEKWGYIDKTGKVVIDYQYTGAREFASGLACVQKNYGSWGFIDTTGKVAIYFIFDRPARFRYNHVMVEKGMEYGYINKQGEFIWKNTQ